ncbi:MAG: PASTA domain-containing protein [Gemmatimonadetes bacterium]|nr:PASTA domain-containing protein [Gemmatimonadota bacterium]
MIRTSRVGLVHGAFLAFALLLVGRAAKVQLYDGATWRARATRQQVADSPLPAPRGRILDASGNVLVESRQLVKLQIAPKEVWGAPTKPKAVDAARVRLQTVARVLARVGVSSEWARKAVDTTDKWVELPGTYLASDVQELVAVRGVHSTPAIERVPPATDGLRRLVGRADENGEPVDGLEKSLDALLRGTRGTTAELRDAKGHRYDSPGVEGTAARPGHTVVLTINQQLQDIAERALDDAVRGMGAKGGDIVVLDPSSGEVRAMASRRADQRSTVATALTEPYEPGSTLKPFTAARLLDLHRARVDEVVNAYGGKWDYNGRTIEDDHKGTSFTLAQVIQYSSNIGIVQFAQRFTPREQFELMRDMGFGMQTGLPYPGESPGRLVAPKGWDKLTPASMAMGYAITVTPLQLATAYAAIANGGELLEPAIVKEVRASDGTVQYSHTRRVVRRVMTEETARTVRGLLRSVVEGGTAEQANLATFDIAGKTGTAKRTVHGKYVNGSYTASFVGLFPADKPQVVILVKLDDPSKSIYGGKAAAPVSKTIIQAMLASRDASLDRAELASSRITPAPKPASATPVATAAATPTAPVARSDRAAQAFASSANGDSAFEGGDTLVRSVASGSVPFVFRLGEAKKAPPAVVAARAVPSVRGLPLRRAVYALHRAGFRVSLDASGVGDAAATSPDAGTVAPAGTTVHLMRAP